LDLWWKKRWSEGPTIRRGEKVRGRDCGCSSENVARKGIRSKVLIKEGGGRIPVGGTFAKKEGGPFKIEGPPGARRRVSRNKKRLCQKKYRPSRGVRGFLGKHHGRERYKCLKEMRDSCAKRAHAEKKTQRETGRKTKIGGSKPQTAGKRNERKGDVNKRRRGKKLREEKRQSPTVRPFWGEGNWKGKRAE